MLSPQTVKTLLEIIGKQGNNKQAENQLMAFKPDPNYILCLMEVLQSSDSQLAQSVAAIEFKNTVKEYWEKQTKQGCDKIHALVIQNLLKIVFSKSGIIADYLNEGALTIAKNEFPGRWESLPEDALSFLSENNHNTNLRVWNLIQGITEKYSYEQRSDRLYREIIDVVKKIHQKLLYYAQGYLNQLKNSQDKENLAGYLEIVSVILKIFYNINWQDLHPCVEDNLKNWFNILSQVMEKTIGDKEALKNDQILADKYFKCKGEAINCALLYAKKYRDDFMDLIKPFADQIWKICTETGDSTRSDQVIIHSLHYFKTFVENPNFIDFFKENLKKMFFKLIIPNLMPDETIEHTFEEEPEAFCETLLANKEFSEKAKNCVGFVKSLSRFQTDGVYETCCLILKEYIDTYRSKGKVNLSNEIVCLNLVSYAPVIGFNLKNGVTCINMPQDLIKETYKKIVKEGLTPIFKLFNQKEAPNESQINQIVTPVLFCYHLKFISNFRMFLDPLELLEIAKFSSYLLKVNNKSLQKTTLMTLFKILNLNDYKTDDKLDAKIDTSSFYRRYYQNPRKLKKNVNRKSKLFNKDNVFPHIKQILENIYSYSSSAENLEPEALLSLRIVFNILKEKLIDYNQGIIMMFKNLFSKLKKGFAYSSIKNLIECLSLYIEHTSKDKDTQILICKELVPVINEAMKLNINDLTSLLIQIYALFIRDYSNPPAQTIKLLLESLLNTENYTSDLVGLYPSYSIFFQEIITRDPKKLVEYGEKLMKASYKFLELRMDDAFFSLFSSIFYILGKNDLKASGWLKFLIEGALVIIKKGGAEKEQIFNSRPLFFKELFLFICKYGVKYSFSDFFVYIEKVCEDSVSQLMSSDHFHNFIEAFIKQPDTSVLIVGLAKLLFSEFKVLVELKLKKCWDRTFVSLLKNMHRRLIGSNRSLRYNKSRDSTDFYKSSEKMQDKIIMNISGESGFYRLNSLRQNEDKIIKMIQKECGDDVQFVAKKIKDFLTNEGKGGDFSFIPKELQEMVNKM